MRRTILVLAAAVVLGAGVVLVPNVSFGQTAGDSAAIRAAALDYIEGWFDGDAARMERALHPELAKRIVRRTEDGGYELVETDATELIAGTRRGGGRDIPAERRETDVRILDVFENAASVRIDAGVWIDYLHLARWKGGWRILNVLWELRPQAARPEAGG